MTKSSAMIVRKAYEDFAQGNVPAVFAVFDPSITWHVPGHSPLSGDYTGHDQVGSFFHRTMELSGNAHRNCSSHQREMLALRPLFDPDAGGALTLTDRGRTVLRAMLPDL